MARDPDRRDAAKPNWEVWRNAAYASSGISVVRRLRPAPNLDVLVTRVGFPAPIVDSAPIEICHGVYVIPDRRVPLVPNVGIITGSRATLVVETGMGPRSGAKIRRHAEALGRGRPLYVTMTHFHGEQSYGAQAFHGAATIICNAGQRDEQRRKGRQYLEMFATIDPVIAAEIEGVRLVEPDIAYDTVADLDLGGLTGQLRAQRPAHTNAGQVVFVPEHRILFTGDLLETRCFAIFPWMPPVDVDADGDGWIAVLAALESLDPAIVVPGHGEIGDATSLSAARGYLQTLRAHTRRLASLGTSEDDAVGELTPVLQARYPDWEHPEWIEGGVRRFHSSYSRDH